VRRDVLDENWSLDELEDRRHKARRMRQAVWFLPLALLALVVQLAVSGGVSALTIAGAVLISIGAITSFQAGSTWVRRWDELVRIKRLQGSPAGSPDESD
jgi:hypothetical protein